MNTAWLWAYLRVFGAAVLITLVLTPCVRWLAPKLGAMDHPSAVKIHLRATPRLGGAAIFCGFLISLLGLGIITESQKGVLIGAILAHGIGFLDDTRSVPAAIKLAALFVITAFLARSGVMVHLCPFPVVNFILTLLWIVGVTSAFNAMDHMDGLAAGLTFFASLAYAYVSFQNGQWAWGLMSVALMGSSLGFLAYNFPPASIFMGDSGSFFLGYLLAAMSIMGIWSTNPMKSMFVPVFILGLPIFDLIYTVIRRQRNRVTRSLNQIVTFSGKDHFSHRLLKMGMTQRQALFFSYAAAFALSLGAVTIRYVFKVEAILLAVQYLITIFLIVILMEFVDRKSKKPIESR